MEQKESDEESETKENSKCRWAVITSRGSLASDYPLEHQQKTKVQGSECVLKKVQPEKEAQEIEKIGTVQSLLTKTGDALCKTLSTWRSAKEMICLRILKSLP